MNCGGHVDTDDVAILNLQSLFKVKWICSRGLPWKIPYEVEHYWILSKGGVHEHILYRK